MAGTDSEKSVNSHAGMCILPGIPARMRQKLTVLNRVNSHSMTSQMIAGTDSEKKR